DRLRVEVIDTGCGIPLDQQKELFKPFSRLGQENGEIEGTGIGLVVTRQLVELMNGSIGFESQEDQGSTFWVELPIAGSQNSDEDDLDAENSSDTSISQPAE
ncbi:MAG: ATP-binding protein, partial [Rhodospirillales bacterium]